MPNAYTMTISRLTIDKLGVKLYDKVSAVIAELVSNSYDADATEVVIEAPMGRYLASKGQNPQTEEYEIVVSDNGIGMTPAQANDYYLKVGAERRVDQRPGRGATSPKGRKVMGRKGVGKLAPFGICDVIEVVTAGGTKVTLDGGEEGYEIAHFIMDKNAILQDTDKECQLIVGEKDGTLQTAPGTKVILKNFAYRLVPNHATFSRQIAQRFGLQTKDWKVVTRDATQNTGNPDYEKVVGEFSVAVMENSVIRFQGERGPKIASDDGGQFPVIGPNSLAISDFRAGFDYDGAFYPIVGWVGYAREPYRDELMAGVRIYCKGKIAAQTALFNRAAGFHGEHDIRSYLVGALHTDWLDEEEDLIQTDRRDILWSHELGAQFQDWGQRVIREIGTITRNPMRQKTWERFLEVGQVNARIEQEFPNAGQEAIKSSAKQLAKLMGQTIRGEEVEDLEVVNPMVDLILTLAPHITLNAELRKAADAENTPLGVISNILKTARLAELLSFGRIAKDRIKVIARLENLKNNPATTEQELQKLVEDAPWLINPQWSPLTANQPFNSLKEQFEKICEAKLGNFEDSLRRPDFVLSSKGKIVNIIEIKRPDHSLTNEEMERIVVYHDQMRDYLDNSSNRAIRGYFDAFHITLVCDAMSLSGSVQAALDGYVSRGVLTHLTWDAFFTETQIAHQDFLAEARRQRFNPGA